MADEILHQMLTTIIDGQQVITKKQDNQASDIMEIRKSMVEIVKLDAQLVGQKEALARVGRHMDKIEHRVNLVEGQVVDLRIVSARVVVKVSVIAAGASAIVASVFAIFVQAAGQ